MTPASTPKNLKKEVFLLRRDVDAIMARNTRVEADKAWEVSGARTAVIAVLTYILIFLFMMFLEDEHPYLNSLIATLGYLVSSATYSALKRRWLQHRKA